MQRPIFDSLVETASDNHGYVTTLQARAAGLWRYPEDVLLQQGSWEDSETVRRFYAGVTDESESIAMRIHGWTQRPLTDGRETLGSA